MRAGCSRESARLSADQASKLLVKQRQVEQPFAGIVDDVENELARIAPDRDWYSMTSRNSLIWRVDSGQTRSVTRAWTWFS